MKMTIAILGIPSQPKTIDQSNRRNNSNNTIKIRQRKYWKTMRGKFNNLEKEVKDKLSIKNDWCTIQFWR